MGRFILFILMLISFVCASQTCVTISDGTYGNAQTTPLTPMYGLYDYSWSSSIYNAADIGAAKTISSLAWYVDGFQSGYSQTGPYTFNNVQIYFAYTTLSGWASTSNVSGVNRLTGINAAQGITSWTKVYDGSITFNASDVYKTITLTSPFSYNGTSNLIVHVDNNDGSYASGYPIFHYTNYNTATSTRTMKYGAQDGSMGPTSGTRMYARPDIKFCTTSALPVELIHFNPFYDYDKVKINWSTASEFNNDYFTIERSYDGVNYDTIGVVDAIGNSTTLTNYTFEDRDITNTIQYYRLRQTDVDGKFKITDWVSVNIISLINDMSIYPNPFNKDINITINSNYDVEQMIKIIDPLGKVVVSELRYLERGINNINIHLDDITEGIYLVDVGGKICKISH